MIFLQLDAVKSHVVVLIFAHMFTEKKDIVSRKKERIGKVKFFDFFQCSGLCTGNSQEKRDIICGRPGPVNINVFQGSLPFP